MFSTILIAFISLIGLIVLHELGHFIVAKRFGVKVDEFGIGYPPRIFGKRIGETVYSLNLLPFGAFVKMPGESEKSDDPRSFSQKPIWQRALIVVAGVVSFWIVAAILLSIVMGLGVPTIIEDGDNGTLVNPKVQIIAISTGSPAEAAGLKVGDIIKKISVAGSGITIGKVKEVQDFTNAHLGENVVLTIERGKENIEVSLVPRSSPPEGQGAMGIGLARTAIKSYPWYRAPAEGVVATLNLTVAIVLALVNALINIFRGVPTGAQLLGPVGIFGLFVQASELGIVYFLQFIAIISVHVAILNILPIPALDGGKLMFLGIEAARRKPVSEKIEQRVTVAFFALLIAIMIWVTIKDISRLF